MAHVMKVVITIHEKGGGGGGGGGVEIIISWVEYNRNTN